MTTEVVDPNSLSDDINLNYRAPEGPIRSFQDDYIDCIIDELVLRTVILGVDPRTIIKEYETKNKTVGYMHLNSLYEALRRAGVRVSESDFSMLLRRYQVYGMFVQVGPLVEDIERSLCRLQSRQRLDFHPLLVVDEISRSHMKVPFAKLKRHDEKLIYPKEFFKCHDTTHPSVDRWPNRENVINTILRIQKYCNAMRRRPEEFFRDFDKIRCGKMLRAQFLTGLDSLASVTGSHSRLQISREEAEDIADIYRDPRTPEYIHWQKFIEDLSEVEAPLQIISTPSANVEQNEPQKLLAELPGRFAGYVRFTKEELQTLEEAIYWVKNKLKETKAQLLPFFRSYDRFNHGFVTPVQFRRVMSSVNINLSYDHGWILVKYYTEKEGFNYTKFVPEVGQEENLKPCREPVKAEPKEIQEERAAPVKEKEFDPPFDTEAATLEGVLMKVKQAVYERRLRLAYYFEQFDELRKHVISRQTFMQAMGSAYDFPLSKREYNILMDAFCDPFDSELILYRGFLRAVNEVDYLEGLEKAPLLVPLPYTPSLASRRQPYSREETAALESIWKRIAGKISLKDWDAFMEVKLVPKVRNCRTLGRLGLEKALDKVGALRLLSASELDLLFQSFAVLHGREVRFDWTAFLRSADLIHRKTKKLY